MILKKMKKYENTDLLDKCYLLRHKVFVECLGWRPYSSDGRERDSYDNSPNMVHFAVCHNEVPFVYCRLIPINEPCLIDEFNVLNPEEKKSLNAYEVSRFSVDKKYVRDNRLNLREGLTSVFDGIIKYSINNGIDKLYAITDTQFEKILDNCGIISTRITNPIRMTDCFAVAGYFNADEKQLINLKRFKNGK